jgi:beta-glucosidase
MNHGVAADAVEAAALALKAGVDIDMTSNSYVQGLPEALKRGLLTMAEIDASVRRVLGLKKRLGLFDDPYRRGSAWPHGARDAERRELARDVGRRAIVLLTNRASILPLSPEIRRLALIGPLAAASREMLGPWASAGRARDAVSVLEGLKAALPQCRIDHAPGVDIGGQGTDGISPALDLCARVEVVVLCLGEAASMSGEAASRADLGLPGCQLALAEAVFDLGKPVVVVLSSGRPLTLPRLFERADAVLASWYLGAEAGHAIADVLTGRFNPTGKLPVSWPRVVGQIPIYFRQRPTGRPTKVGEHYSSSYLDVPATPQFPFGHGLSYSRFALLDMKCDPSSAKAGEFVEVSVTVRNDSEVDGEATLFLFVHDLVASVSRPLLELKGVRKIALKGQEHGRATWRLSTGDLSFLGPNLVPVLEPGQFEIHVGQSADPTGLLTEVIELTT